MGRRKHLINTVDTAKINPDEGSDEALLFAIQMLFEKLFYKEALENASLRADSIESLDKMLNKSTVIDREQMINREYLAAIEEFVNFMCGTESMEKVIERQSSRVLTEFRRIGNKAYVDKITEFFQKINKEYEDMENNI